MEIRLNKLISDTGICSRREADEFIESGRVTVNGNLPHVGQKVSENDIVLLDDIRIQLSKQAIEKARAAAGKPAPRIVGKEKKSTPAKTSSPEKKAKAQSSGPASNGLRPGKYVKYNKYAAARKAAKSGSKPNKEANADEKLLKEAMQPKFGKSLSRSAVAQRIAASPKSASLRKTSHNNPANKAKRMNLRNKPKEE